MSSGKKKYILLELFLGALVVVFAVFLLYQKQDDKLFKVAVVIPNADSNQCAALKYGLRMASEDQNVKLVVASTDVVTSMEEEIKTIRFVIKKGADAVVVQPMPGKDAEEMLKSVSSKVPILLVGSAAVYDREESSFVTVEVDVDGLMKQLIEEVLDDNKGDIRGKTFGVFSADVASDIVYRKRDVVYEQLEELGATISWKFTGNLKEDGLVLLQNQKPVDYILALDDQSVVLAGDCMKDQRLHGAEIYGVGNSMEALYYLDQGSITCLVVPDLFDAGYQSMTQIVQKLHSSAYNMKNIDVDYSVIRRYNMFSDENQELLFTMSQ